MVETIVLNKKGLIVESERLFYKDNHNWIFRGDARSMWELPNECVQMVCTSPPYWSLRKYSGDQDLIWGGDKDCEHQWGDTIIRRDRGKATNSEIVRQPRKMIGTTTPQGSFCSLCGAWKGAYGLEPTPEMYVEHTIEILREIRRVLRKDGVVFWNIGDSYNSAQSGYGEWTGEKARQGDGEFKKRGMSRIGIKHPTIKPLDLCLIPFRVAIAAQEDGWWVRSVIIWDKNNPMPESVNGWRWERHRVKVGNRGRKQAAQKGHFQDHSGNEVISDAIWQDCPGCSKCSPNDGYVLHKGSWRPTESHEFILMLTKSDNYYCDREAVKEEYTEPLNKWGGDSKKLTDHLKEDSPYTSAHRERDMRPDPGGRNLRSVWSFPTMPFPSFKIDGREVDHFAVFPEKLPQLCIKAATPEVGCCAKCGAPWARVLEKEPSEFNIRVRDAKAGRATPEEGYKATEEELARYPGNHPDPGYSRTVGWRPSCKCNAPRVPSLVLDPMMGAGTTLEEAKNLNRYAAGYELAEEYCQLAVERCRQQVLL